jgi:hypothetical protein
VNAKNALLVVFIILTLIFASTTFIEYNQVTTRSTTATVTRTVTNTPATAQFASRVCLKGVPQSAVIGSYSGQPLTNSSSPAKSVSVYDVTARFYFWQWNATRFSIGGYQINAIDNSSTGNMVYLEPRVSLDVSNGQKTEVASYSNLGGLNGQSWPPDFPQGQVTLFNGSVAIQWFFTCDMRVFLEVSVSS